MKPAIRIALPALCLALLLGACGSSSRTNHYMLSAHEAPVPGGQTPSLGIGPIDIPQYLNRNALVYQRDGNQLQVSAQDRWAEPLGDGIQRVLAINLAGLLDTGDISYFPWHARRSPDFGVQVTVLNLDASDRQARLVAEWLVYAGSTDTPVARRISELRQDLPAGALSPAQIAPAYSVLLYRLSEIIAGEIRAARSAP